MILAIAATFVAACGSSSGGRGLLSQTQNSTISGELSAISDAVSAGSCARASSAVNQLEDTLAQLPARVNQRLAHNLGQGATTVKSLALTQCHATHTSSTSSKTQSTTTTQSTPATSSTSTTATTQSTPATVSTPATNTQPTPPPGTSTQTSPTSVTTNGGAGLAPGSQ